MSAPPKSSHANLRQTLYQGDFLSDFYLPDSNAFESWDQEERLRLRRRALAALSALTASCLSRQAYREAEQYARR